MTPFPQSVEQSLVVIPTKLLENERCPFGQMLNDGQIIAGAHRRSIVNDVGVEDVSRELLAVIGKWDQSIPANHYFVIAEERTSVVEHGQVKEGVSRYCALTGADNITK